MSAFDFPSLTVAVFPVLVGPLQTLLALLPAILVGVGSLLFAAFKPSGFVKLMRFCWKQKLFLGSVVLVVVAWRSIPPTMRLFGRAASVPLSNSSMTSNWEADRGGMLRLGRGPGEFDPTAATSVWKNDRDQTVLSSPAVAGDHIVFSTATDIGPFTPTGRGAIVCVDAHSGRELWRYAPDHFRATFSSPVIYGDAVVCGEGLHQVDDARITCLDVRTGERRWEFRTKSHVESTAAIADGRVFVGAGADGFYCLALETSEDEQPRVLWHLDGDEFPDCESSPLVNDGVVYFGLGEGGLGVCAVDAATGRLLWRVATPYPVFAPPAIANGKLIIATGNGNYVQSAADLLAMKLQGLQDNGATEQELAAARERWKPIGEVWSIDLATHAVDWKFTTGDAILGAVACGEDSLYFGSRDGVMYRVSLDGHLLQKGELREPIVASPALGRSHVYAATTSGRLFALDAKSLQPMWDVSLGGGETFSSSPIIAHGHIYIGTAQQGVLCFGDVGEPEPPVWANGEQGGGEVGTAVPESLSVVWQYPEEGESPLHATAPLMPLDGAVYVAGVRGNQHQFLKLNPSATTAPERLVWTQKFNGPIFLPPVGSGRSLCVVEGDLNRSSAATLHCLDAMSGSILWSSPLPNRPTGVTVDARRVFVWIAGERLRCVGLVDGKPLWDEPTPNGGGIGAPCVQHQIAFAATDGCLFARDAETGALLWSTTLKQSPSRGPIVDQEHVLLTTGDAVAVHSLIDGAFVRMQPPKMNEDVARVTSLIDSSTVGRHLTPPVFQRGRAYVGTERAVLCLGGESR